MAGHESLDKREKTDDAPTPEERHEEFERQNGEWNRKVEEALTELDELASEPDRAG
jgi:hypothetical protein